MKKTTFLYLFLIILLTANIYWIYQEKINKAKIQNLTYKLLAGNEAISDQANKLVKRLEAEDIIIDINQDILDEKGMNKKLSTVIQENQLSLIVRYSKLNCQTCVSSDLKILNGLFSKEDKKKVFFLSRYNTEMEMHQFKRSNHIENEVLKLDNEITQIDELNIPYFFCLTKEGQIDKVFIPDENKKELTEVYLKYILSIIQSN